MRPIGMSFLLKVRARGESHLHGTMPIVSTTFQSVFISYCLHWSQFDYGGWMPNTPSSLQQPPPTTKGTTSEATLLQTLPDVNTTVKGMSTLWLLSKQSTDFVSAQVFNQIKMHVQVVYVLLSKTGQYFKLSKVWFKIDTLTNSFFKCIPVVRSLLASTQRNTLVRNNPASW